MGRLQLSAEQRNAIFTPGSLAVRAGAGSGKTEVLARRFVALLAGDIEGTEPLSPEQIAAITFTEKATYDMRRRIAQVLDEQLTIATGERAVRLGRARRLLPLSRISTIHAFCARILRENPLEAGLDPNFAVLDEDQSRTRLEQTVEEVILAALRRGHPGALHLVGARGLRGGTNRDGAIGIVVNLVTELQRLGVASDRLREATEATCRKIESESQAISKYAIRIKELIEELRRADLSGKKAGEKMGRFESRWPRYREVLESFSAASSRGELDTLRELCDALPDARAGAIKETVKAIRQLIAKNGSGAGLEGELIEAYGAQRAVQPTLDTCALIADIAGEVERRKRRDGVASFDDLLGHTLRLLNGDPAIVRRYRHALRAILVDEYQDTDPVQDAIVGLLTEPRAELPALEYFIVGDEKQSIYRFRGADVTVFRAALAAAPGVRPLSESRRAVPNLIKFVNALSAHVMHSETQPALPFWIEWEDGHRLREVRVPLVHDEPSVEVILWPAPASDESRQSTAAGRALEARAIAHRCRRMIGNAVVSDWDGNLHPAQPRDIALLLRSFTDVQIYERALSEAGIPCYTVKGRGFFGCREILDIVELLTAVNDPNDSLAIAAALRSPLFALSDECLMEIALRNNADGLSLAGRFAADAPDFDWLATGREEAVHAWNVLHELRVMREHASLVAILERALGLTDFEAVMIAQSRGAQRVANIRKLIEIARDFESRSFSTLADFISHLKRLTTDQPNEPQAQMLGENEDVMSLMTIHQAKGLEFPIVVLADLGRKSPNLPSNFLLSPKDGLLMRDTIGSGDDELPHPLIKEQKQLLDEQDKAESARLLYVAITRARDRLILSEGAGNKGWYKQLRAFLGERVGAFLGSRADEQTIEIGGAAVTLRRAQTVEEESGDVPAPSPPNPAEVELFIRRARERLGFVPTPDDELTVSPTAMADFDRCPRQYRLRHELRVPEHDGFLDDGGNAIERGTVAHAVLEIVDLDLRGAALETAIARALDLCAGANLTSAERTELDRDLRRYVESRGSGERIIGREVPFFMNIADSGPALFVRGQIDLIVEHDDAILIRDYKYARRADGDLADYRVPMECYRLAAAGAYPGREIRAELFFLRGRPEACALPMPAVDESRARLLEIGRAMIAARTGGDYAKKPDGPDECRRLRCGYVRRCWQA